MGHSKIRNMEEFAALSGISRPTVSKYFNDPESVRSSTRAKIEASLKQYDYQPNVFAINQNRRTTKNIGIVVPNLADPFFSEIGRRVELACIAAGYSPILQSSHGSPEMERDNLNSLRSLKPAGVLLAPFGRMSDADAVKSFDDDFPLVLFDANMDGIGQAFVGTDNYQSVDLMVEYLCRSGEAPCFFEMKYPSNPNANKRRQAYIQSMERHGHAPRIFQADGEGWNFEEIGRTEGGRFLSAKEFSTNTILCSNDRLAIGMLSAAYSLGLRVGHGADCDLRIAGHDDHPFSQFTCPPLTTIAQDYETIANRAVSELFGMLENNDRLSDRTETTFYGRLIMRDSA
ncbi:LacI family transcriptional regulator [Roseobacter denitrificans]|uniref:Transcriptional regulator, lacI family, putative n=1 Tax=Roseobacter denitrificans (strain ATCC 33942 / OCh 114) TaxID=375451 RepID=Q16A73_ROSDO|nr:LacI family DNA-binding transcriptional regulator [Roseobacter denitrificans]ABG31120.1 transcriptional regulator, lacI family, putative [Roseobacter denitrificans OCh 114]AVL54190.1 LacI family transcriptional regulator [Roseobacter denitrificans]SFG32612.1 transcriptional regulator, LacI family [Roseobacter denitrificans OCh 114]